jgi:ribosomal protein S18 acetylase RimI-like enzyme
MPTDVAIRRAGLDDLPLVLRLWQEAEVTPSGPTDSLEGLTRLIRHPGGILLIASIDGQIVGSVIGGWDGWRGSIYRLPVTPAYRRRGIARELVAAISSALFANGAERISGYRRWWSTHTCGRRLFGIR